MYIEQWTRTLHHGGVSIILLLQFKLRRTSVMWNGRDRQTVWCSWFTSTPIPNPHSHTSITKAAYRSRYFRGRGVTIISSSSTSRISGTQASFSFSPLSEGGSRDIPQCKPRPGRLDEGLECLLEGRGCPSVSLKHTAGLQGSGGGRLGGKPRMSG